MSFTKYEYLKITKQYHDNAIALGIDIPSDYGRAEVYASVLRLGRKGFDRAEAVEIAGQWHELTSDQVQAIVEDMEQNLEAIELPRWEPYDEGQFDNDES